MSDRSFTIHTASANFYAQQRGENPRAVFLHGFGGDLHTWDSLWNALGDALPSLRYDLRDFGQSISRDDSSRDDNSRDDNPFDHTEDLRDILDALNIAQCDLIGVSMGGSVALNFALENPARVRNLVLISPGIVAWEWSPTWRERWKAITAKARAGFMDEARELWWQHPLFASTRNSAAASALYESIQRFSGRQWIRENHRLMLPDVERLHLLATRTLLLTGARDVKDFRLTADLIEASAANVRRIDLPGSGHLLHLEEPERCAREILSFLDFLPTF